MVYERQRSVNDNEVFKDGADVAPTRGVLFFSVDKDGKIRASRSLVDGTIVIANSSFIDIPPSGTPNFRKLLVGALGEDGLDDGNIDLAVDGSSNPVDFFIEAHADYDTYISKAVLLIAANNVSLKNFGHILRANVPIGFDLKLIEGPDTSTVLNKARTGGDVVLQSGANNPFGDSNTAFEVVSWWDTNDAQIIHIPFNEWTDEKGARLGRGTTDKLVATVNDDFRSLFEFKIRIFGSRIFPIS